MRFAFCFSRSCRPYPTIFALRSLPCWPGAKLRFSIGHLSVKHFAPLRNSFMPSRRQRRHTASLYRAKLCSPCGMQPVHPAIDRFTGAWRPFVPIKNQWLVDSGQWLVTALPRDQNPPPEIYCPTTSDRGWYFFYPLTTIHLLHPAALGRTAAIVWNRRDVADGPHVETGGGECAHCRFAPRSRAADPHIHAAHAVIACLIGGVRGGLLRREWRALPRSAEAQRSRALPRHCVPREIGDGDDRVVEGCLNVH